MAIGKEAAVLFKSDKLILCKGEMIGQRYRKEVLC